MQPLTPTERQLMELIADGQTTAEAANATGHTRWQIRWRLRTIYIKLNARNIHHAAAIYAVLRAHQP